MATVKDFFKYLVADGGLQIFLNEKEDKITIVEERMNSYEKYLLSLYCREVYAVTDIYYQEGDKSIRLNSK